MSRSNAEETTRDVLRVGELDVVEPPKADEGRLLFDKAEADATAATSAGRRGDECAEPVTDMDTRRWFSAALPARESRVEAIGGRPAAILLKLPRGVGLCPTLLGSRPTILVRPRLDVGVEAARAPFSSLPSDTLFKLEFTFSVTRRTD